MENYKILKLITLHLSIKRLEINLVYIESEGITLLFHMKQTEFEVQNVKGKVLVLISYALCQKVLLRECQHNAFLKLALNLSEWSAPRRRK
jgi:hypothetical protein